MERQNVKAIRNKRKYGNLYGSETETDRQRRRKGERIEVLKSTECTCF